jgi:hypothetical protein
MLFTSLAKNSKKGRLFLGAPEAEAEATAHSKVLLTEVYEDWHDLFNMLAHEKFIVIGRKGSGKSAFARYTQIKSNDEPNLFVDFVKQGTMNLETLVQIGSQNGHPFEKEVIFKWLIYTHLIKLFCENEAIKEDRNFNDLKYFITRNSGYVNITELEKTEVVNNGGFEVNIEPLKRFYKFKVKKDFSIKSQKAPFYKLIPHLEEVVKAVLNSSFEAINKNSYAIFFDDLDVGFDISDINTVDNVVSLLRVAKTINNEVFGNIPGQAKVIILLRDDVEKYVSDNYPDTAKLLSSYSASINWYQDDYHINDSETLLNIRKFIDLRIRKAFDTAQLPCLSKPWNSLVDEKESYGGKTCFKFILDHTLFRPRDLLLFFSPLETGNYDIPLRKKSINHLISKYSSQLIKEFRNEIISFYSQKEISQVISFLKLIHDRYHYPSFDESIIIFNDIYTGEKNVSAIINDLFDRSVIGACSQNSNYKFKYREPLDEVYKLEKDDEVVLHYGFKAHFSKTI